METIDRDCEMTEYYERGISVLAKGSPLVRQGNFFLLPNDSLFFCTEFLAQAYWTAKSTNAMPSSILLVLPSIKNEKILGLEKVQESIIGGMQTLLLPLSGNNHGSNIGNDEESDFFIERDTHESWQTHLILCRILFPGVPILPLIMGTETDSEAMNTLAKKITQNNQHKNSIGFFVDSLTVLAPYKNIFPDEIENHTLSPVFRFFSALCTATNRKRYRGGIQPERLQYRDKVIYHTLLIA